MPPSTVHTNDYTPMPFSFFISLCRNIADIRAKRVSETHLVKGGARQPKVLQLFAKWIEALRERYPRPPPRTMLAVYRCLFPEEDNRRKYDMQESRLAPVLLKVFGVNGSKGCRGEFLLNWPNVTMEFTCLGDGVRALLADVVSDENNESSLTMTEVDELLTELAGTSAFSSPSIRQASNKRTRRHILHDLYKDLQPLDAAVVTQIILKDLRPILYPVKTTGGIESLIDFNTKSVYCLSLSEAFRLWDPNNTLSKCYRMQATLEDAIGIFESPQARDPQPKVGVPIEIPKSFKGLGCSHAIKQLKSAMTIWAETKYDGERMQIHVEVKSPTDSRITIFSKSKRDSTLDRIATHWIIREALGLPHRDKDEVLGKRRTSARRSQIETIIIEAEMVAYKEGTGIDEFLHIRNLIESSAYGVRGRKKGTASASNTLEDRHLALVFFDILYLNGESLLSEPYSSRRAILESIVGEIREYALIAQRKEIICEGARGEERALSQLESIFADCVAKCEEGLVLKASNSTYCDRRLPWVKVKKDYIKGHGDCIDVAIIGASWDKERGRELRVPPSVFTTFYIGILSSQGGHNGTKPLIEVYFTTSYGLDRRSLENLNFLLKSSRLVQPNQSNLSELPYNLTLHSNMRQPTVLLGKPLLAEVYGAGFTKSPGGKFYELRHPRMSKVHRENDRSWTDGIRMDELERIAISTIAIGEDPSNDEDREIEEWCAELFRKANASQKRCASDAFKAEGWVASTKRFVELSPKKKARRDNNEENPQQSISLAQNTRETQSKPLVPIENVRMRSNMKVGVIATKAIDGEDEQRTHCSASLMSHLRKSWIWIPEYNKELRANVTEIQTVAANMIHLFEAFLVGCGWTNCKQQSRSGRRRQGIIFVNKEKSYDILEKLSLAARTTDDTDRKPILILNLSAFSKAKQVGGDKDVVLEDYFIARIV